MRYTYPGPIDDLVHRLMVIPPPRHGGQRCITERLTILPEGRCIQDHDAFGNIVVNFYTPRVETVFDIDLDTLVERDDGEPHRIEMRWLTGDVFRRSTALTQPDDALLDAARTLRSQYEDDGELADAINAYVYRQMRYTPGVTDVETTASQAFARRAGVCQDYAHIMIAIARACGLAARYVSGHLLGEGGTHAWVEIVLPSADGRAAVAWPYDPTHDRRDGPGYVVIAVGRDYGDVAPTSGTFRASYGGELTAEKTMTVE